MPRVFGLVGPLVIGACGFDGVGSAPGDAGSADAPFPTPTPTASTEGGPPPPQCPAPLLDFGFAELTGTTTRNAGTAAPGATGTLFVQSGFPAFTTNIPSGAFAPPSSASAMDFGMVEGPDKERGVDFGDAVATPTQGLSAFTVAGWLNVRSQTTGPGGNRILSTHIPGNDAGLDLVQQGRALRLGVNQYADQGNPPQSSAKLTVDAAVGASNWVFFAVIYDARPPAGGDGTVSFFFGTTAAEAALDVSAPYDRGAVKPPPQHLLTIGNFTPEDGERDATGNGSRILRAVIDDLRFFGRALTLEEIRCHQRR